MSGFQNDEWRGLSALFVRRHDPPFIHCLVVALCTSRKEALTVYRSGLTNPYTTIEATSTVIYTFLYPP